MRRCLDHRHGDLSLHLHIIGICGTFMGGIAALARAPGTASRAPTATSIRR
jgi:hypothetical protein